MPSTLVLYLLIQSFLFYYSSKEDSKYNTTDTTVYEYDEEYSEEEFEDDVVTEDVQECTKGEVNDIFIINSI